MYIKGSINDVSDKLFLSDRRHTLRGVFKDGRVVAECWHVLGGEAKKKRDVIDLESTNVFVI